MKQNEIEAKFSMEYVDNNLNIEVRGSLDNIVTLLVYSCEMNHDIENILTCAIDYIQSKRASDALG